jgi:hypothetical protein
LRKLAGLFVLVATAAVLVSACGFINSEMTLEDCLDEAGQGFQDAMAANGEGSIPDEKLEPAIRPLCEEFIRTPDSDSMDDEEMRRFLSDVFHEKPATYQPLCYLAIDAEFAAFPAEARYLTQEDRETFRRDVCRLQVDYMREDSLAIDYGSLVRDHPDLFAPLCAAGIQLAFAEDPWVRDSFSAKEKRTIARRTCLEALDTGVIDASGPGGLRSPRVDAQAFCRLIGKVTRQVVGGGAVPTSGCA